MTMKILRSGAAAALSALVMLGCDNGTTPPERQAAVPRAAVQALVPADAQSALPEPQNTTDASVLGPAGSVTLFAGHDLTSFDTLGDAQWRVVDGVVEAEGMASFLVTKGQYSDFELRVEFWPSSDANSGVFIRCGNPAEVGAESCYEINIFDQNENPANRTGAIIGHAAPMTSIAAGDQWNTYVIRAAGPRITVMLNDTLVADIENEEHPAGAIALQSNGGLIRFRSVQLRPL